MCWDTGWLSRCDNLWYGHLQAAMKVQQESNFVSFPSAPEHYYEYQKRIYGEMQ